MQLLFFKKLKPSLSLYVDILIYMCIINFISGGKVNFNTVSITRKEKYFLKKSKRYTWQALLYHTYIGNLYKGLNLTWTHRPWDHYIVIKIFLVIANGLYIQSNQRLKCWTSHHTKFKTKTWFNKLAKTWDISQPSSFSSFLFR